MPQNRQYNTVAARGHFTLLITSNLQPYQSPQNTAILGIKKQLPITRYRLPQTPTENLLAVGVHWVCYAVAISALQARSNNSCQPIRAYLQHYKKHQDLIGLPCERLPKLGPYPHDHFVQMPFISNVRTFPTKLIGLLLPEFLAPLPHRFIGEFDAAIQHYLLNVPVAQRKGVVEPDTAANNFAGKFRTGVHEPGIMSEVEPGRLFYLWVKLTIPVYPTRSTGKIVCPTARSSDGLILQGGDRGIEQS